MQENDKYISHTEHALRIVTSAAVEEAYWHALKMVSLAAGIEGALEMQLPALCQSVLDLDRKHKYGFFDRISVAVQEAMQGDDQERKRRNGQWCSNHFKNVACRCLHRRFN